MDVLSALTLHELSAHEGNDNTSLIVSSWLFAACDPLTVAFASEWVASHVVTELGRRCPGRIEVPGALTGFERTFLGFAQAVADGTWVPGSLVESLLDDSESIGHVAEITFTVACQALRMLRNLFALQTGAPQTAGDADPVGPLRLAVGVLTEALSAAELI